MTTAVSKWGAGFNEDPYVSKKVRKPWLDQLKIAQSISGVVVNEKARIGDYLVGDESLGGEIQVVIGHCLPFAIYQDPDNGWKPKKDPAPSYDPTSNNFKAIEECESLKKKGAKTGYQFLVYLVDRDDFVTFYVTGSAKTEKDALLRARDDNPGKIVTLGTKRVGSKKIPVPVVTSVSDQSPTVTDEDLERAYRLFTKDVETGQEAAGAGSRPR